jgi:hypothetical protein
MRDDERFSQISDVQARHAPALMQKPHVIGVGIGNKKVKGQATGDLALVVMVDEKLPLAQLAPDEVLPRELDGVPVDVQAMGGGFKAE